MIDASLHYAAGSTKLVVCSAQPTTYAEANATYALADVVIDSGDFTKADDTSGRKVTIGAQSAVPIEHDRHGHPRGFDRNLWQHLALCDHVHQSGACLWRYCGRASLEDQHSRPRLT